LLDILGLKLNSKIVVLSAGDTSQGRLLPGEGVLGAAQAFLQAGSSAVLASYWKVDDQVTSTFMQRFYEYRLVDRSSASAALRKPHWRAPQPADLRVGRLFPLRLARWLR
jgi:CHAT domain-containing protein